MRHNIRRAYEALRNRCRAPTANGPSSTQAILSRHAWDGTWSEHLQSAAGADWGWQRKGILISRGVRGASGGKGLQAARAGRAGSCSPRPWVAVLIVPKTLSVGDPFPMGGVRAPSTPRLRPVGGLSGACRGPYSPQRECPVVGFCPRTAPTARQAFPYTATTPGKGRRG